MKHFTKLFQANNIKEANYRFYFANHHAYLIGGFAHVCFVPLFYSLDLFFLSYYNILSVLIFILSFMLNRKGLHALSTMPVTIEVIIHAILTVYFIGWESGFFFYTLAIIPMAFSAPSTKESHKVILTILVSTFFVALKYFSNTHTPDVMLDENLLHTLYYVNSFFMIISIAALVHYSSLGSKISEDKIGEERNTAASANKAKSVFLANMSHELRTPLNAIIGYSEMLKDEADDNGDEQNSKDLARITSAGSHLLELINNILDLTKIEAGKTELEYRPTDISPLINDIVSTINPLILKNNNTLVINCDDNFGYASIDQTKVKQILINLVSNACKFTEKGKIELTVYNEEKDNKKWLCFKVSDSGIGIAKEKINVLFEPFMQADISTTRVYGGTGLGLAISKHFVTLMEGTINVESIINKGTTFLVRLPVK